MVKGGIIAVKGVKILGDCAYVLSSSKRGRLLEQDLVMRLYLES